MISSRDSGTIKPKVISRRIFILSVAKLVVITGLVGRLFSLQISANNKYKTLSDKNRLREWKLPPIRGEFIDFFGKTVAGNKEVYRLHVIPEQVEDFNRLLSRLKTILDLSNNEYANIIKKKNKQKSWETIIISENLTWSQFSKLNLYLHELDGAKPVLSVLRDYPYKENFTHVLGYLSKASTLDIENNDAIKKNYVSGLRVGKSGLEKTFEKDLIGTNGIQRYEVNAYGKRINQLDYIIGKKGKNITLTIDTEVQMYANELLKGTSGSISVMDIYTGEIIAIQSSPTFDPSLFLDGISVKNWNTIRENPLKPLFNKTIAGLYSPGSTIKPIVALSALENDVVSPKLEIKCEGKIEFYGQTYHCWKKKGHGYLNLRNAIKQSCDTYFYEISRRLGVDRLNLTAKKFGLGNKVLNGAFLEEKNGLVPSTKWKKNNLGRGWLLGETLITGIGQGYIQTTPLQLCLMTAQLANGGFKIFPKITINDDYEDYETIKYKMFQEILNKEDKNVGLIQTSKELLAPSKKEHEILFRNQENVKFVLESMYASTNEIQGTSYSSRITDKKYQFAGKTGTSQVKRITERARELDLETSQIPYEERDHALYVAYGPYINPRYAMSIIIEHGGSGSSAAAPLAKKLFKLVIDRHELREKIKKKNRKI